MTCKWSFVEQMADAIDAVPFYTDETVIPPDASADSALDSGYVPDV